MSRSVFDWYSEYGGHTAVRRGHQCRFSSGVAGPGAGSRNTLSPSCRRDVGIRQEVQGTRPGAAARHRATATTA